MNKKIMLTECEDLMSEWDYEKNIDIIPETFTAGSGIKVWWLCHNKHSWQATINHRHCGSSCPICKNKKILKGYNDLATTNPEITKQWNYDRNTYIKPSEIFAGSHRKVWWICNENHEWEATVESRAKNGHGCPYCAGQRVIRGFNDILTCFPQIANEWDYEKNYPLIPEQICKSSNKKYWWVCDKKHLWQAAPSARYNGGCPYCAGKVLISDVNSLAVKNPLITSEWDYKKNVLTPDEVFANSSKQAWWICCKGHSWRAKINNRNNGRGCPICSGHTLLEGYNDLRRKRPDLANEWNYEKNNDLKPEKIMPNSRKSIWWKCINGHEWISTPNNRIKNSNCPYCTGLFPIKGETDFKSICPDLANEWDYVKNTTKPDEILPQSNKKVWWKCKYGHEWQATVSNRYLGKGCPYCSGRTAISGCNDLKTLYPDIAAEWCYEKNKHLLPTEISAVSGKKAWWECKNGHHWRAVVASRTKGLLGCPHCNGIKKYIKKYVK